MSTLFSDTLTVSISSSRIRDCSSGYKTSQIGSSRCKAWVISAKSTVLVRVVAASRLRIESSRLFIWSLNSRVADYVPDVLESLEPRYRDFGIEVPSLTVEQFWTQVTDFGIDEIDLIKLDCEGAEYLIVSELSALGLMNRIGWIRGEWHSRKDNVLLGKCLWQTHAYNIDPNLPHEVGMFVGHRI